eukprot:m.234247 g.234247  ORF g.234247 m.234247 type:complete len:50 (+) comp40107_c1_seq5:1036-1185(+)
MARIWDIPKCQVNKKHENSGTTEQSGISSGTFHSFHCHIALPEIWSGVC